MKPADYLDKFTRAVKSWDSWTGFAAVCSTGFLLISAIDISLAHLVQSVFSPNVIYRPYIFLLTYIIPFIIYAALFFGRRLYIKLFLSRKINIVFAYNLESVGVTEFSETYNRLIKEIRNQINLHNLGNQIKIIVCPTDINLREQTAAEAKTKIGLVGSTLLVWGYVSHYRGSNKFNTKFSYEFGHDINLPKDIAKKSVNKYIEDVLSKSLMSSIRLENFHLQLLPTIYFILGVCSFTLGNNDRAELMFESFRRAFKEEPDILRRRELGPALSKVENILLSIYSRKIDTKFYLSIRPTNEIISISNKMIEIDPDNYYANMNLAYLAAERGDIDAAENFSRIAESNIASNAQHAHFFNNAYFNILKKDYKRAVECYKFIPDEPAVNISPIVKFLGNKMDKTKNSDFQFAYGYVNYRWGDSREGRKYLRRYLKSRSTNNFFVEYISELNII